MMSESTRVRNVLRGAIGAAALATALIFLFPPSGSAQQGGSSTPSSQNPNAQPANCSQGEKGGAWTYYAEPKCENCKDPPQEGDPADSREPSDPPPPPEGKGPTTPSEDQELKKLRQLIDGDDDANSAMIGGGGGISTIAATAMQPGSANCCLVPHSGEIDTSVPLGGCAMPGPADENKQDGDDGKDGDADTNDPG